MTADDLCECIWQQLIQMKRRDDVPALIVLNETDYATLRLSAVYRQQAARRPPSLFGLPLACSTDDEALPEVYPRRRS